jgi:hypothetical protein
MADSGKQFPTRGVITMQAHSILVPALNSHINSGTIHRGGAAVVTIRTMVIKLRIRKAIQLVKQ